MHKIKSLFKKIIKKLAGIPNNKKSRLLMLIISAFIAAVSVLVGLLTNVIAAIAAAVLLIILSAFPAYVNTKTVYWLSKERPTSYFQDLRFRNMEGIVVGSTKAWKYLDMNDLEDRIYNCTTYKRAFAMDFATLKTYYSHVRKGGRVILVVDYEEAEEIGYKILPRDFNYIHPHIFLQLGKKADKEKAALPLIYYPGFTLRYFFYKLKKNMGGYRKGSWKLSKDKNLDINTEKVKKMVDKIDAVVHFCWDRELEPEVLLLNAGADNNCANDIIRAYFAPRFPEVNIRLVDDAAKMNELIRA